MNRRLTQVGLPLSLLVSSCTALRSPTTLQAAEESQPGATSPSARPDADAAEFSTDEFVRLQRLRQIIENVEDSMGTRVAQAQELLSTGSPASTEIAAELLRGAPAPSTREVVCRAVAAIGAKNPTLLGEHHRRLVEPLLGLLGNDSNGVSAKAAAALAAFPDGNVTHQLGQLAVDGDAPLEQRLAAVDALALNVYQRHAVRQLVALLEREDGPFRVRVVSALRSASRQDFGDDVAAWQTWWEQEEQALRDAEWVADRAKLFYLQLVEAQRTFVHLQEVDRRRYEALADRLKSCIREIYRLNSQPAEKDEALLRWLSDSIIECRLAAATLVKEQIEDGNLPSDAVATVLIGELNDKSPEMRRAVLGIVGALGLPAHAEAVLARLENEQDVVVRETALRVLGQLRNLAAVNALITELDDASASSGCVAEAANALGVLGAKGRVEPSVIAPAIPVLKSRFEATPSSDARLKEALLRAMASLGASEFRAEFVAALASDEPELLMDAIRGLTAIEDAAELDRLLTCTGHADPRVREVAVEALGILGGESAHIEALLGRLNASAEPAESVRNAAWEALRTILGRQALSVRLEWADRLSETPEREVAYLGELVEELATDNPPPPELNAARRRLATLHTSRGDLAAALPIWQQLYAALKTADDPQAPDVGITLLAAALGAGHHDVAKETMLALSSAAPDVKARARDQIRDHVESQRAAERPARLIPLLDALLSLPPDTLGPGFHAYLLEVKQALTAPPASAPAESTD